MSIDKNRLQIQDGKLYIDGILTTIPKISSFVSVKDAGERGAVVFAIDNLSRPVAVKIWLRASDYSEDTFKEGLKEASKLANLEHPNILHVFYADALNNKRFYSVMKRLDGPTLEKYLNKATKLDERYSIWFDIARAINYAHENGIYHGDLHLRNIAVENGRAKVFDFGVSTSELVSSFLQEKECSQLIELSQKLFPEFNQKVLRPINPITQNPYTPEIVLCQLVAWISWQGVYLGLKQTINHHSEDDYMIRHFLNLLSIITGNAPLFDLDEIIKEVNELLLSRLPLEDCLGYLHWFLSGLYAHCRGMFFGYSVGQSIPVNIDNDALIFMNRELYGLWQAKFLLMDRQFYIKSVKVLISQDNNPVSLPLRFAGPID